MLEMEIELLRKFEDYYIDFFDTKNPIFGYNKAKTSTPSKGYYHTQDAHEKMRNSWTPEKRKITGERMRELNLGNTIMRGYKHSEETNKKNSIAHSGEKHPLYGKKHKEESIERMKSAQPGTRPVTQLDLNNNIIKEWPSIREVNRQLKISRFALKKCCLGERDSVNGFKWRYKDEN